MQPVQKYWESLTRTRLGTVWPTAAFHCGFRKIFGKKFKGNRLSLCVQGGEAYTHAAGQVLSMPILSNDYAAINTLRNSGCPTAVPALRSFDLFCFAYKQKWLDTGSFKSLLQALASKKEWIHQDFLGMPWPQLEEKIKTFQCRLIVWEKHGSSPPSPNKYMDPLYLTFSG